MEDKDADEEDIDVLIGRKKLDDDGEAVASPMAHAPYFPAVHLLNETILMHRNTNQDGGHS